MTARATRNRTPAQNRRYNLRHRCGYDDETLDYCEVLRYDPCAYCGGPAGHVDHVDPPSAGGAAHWTNLTATCADCNSFKAKRKLLKTMLHNVGCYVYVAPRAHIQIVGDAPFA